VAVQANGRAPALWWVTKASMRRTSSRTVRKEPRRIARCVMCPNQRSTWFSDEA
jgi:hypothetical protein